MNEKTEEHQQIDNELPHTAITHFEIITPD